MPAAISVKNLIFDYVRSAEDNGIEIIIGAAGKAAHLPGIMAGLTTLPVIGIPIKTSFEGGLDSLLSIVQMPGGVPVATVAIGKAGAINAGLLAVQILSIENQDLADQLEKRREDLKQKVLESSEDLV